MKRQRYYFSVLCGALAVVGGLICCGQEVPKTEAPKATAPSVPAATSKSVTESTGQAVVDSIKMPLDKSRAVEGTLS